MSHHLFERVLRKYLSPKVICSIQSKLETLQSKVSHQLLFFMYNCIVLIVQVRKFVVNNGLSWIFRTETSCFRTLLCIGMNNTYTIYNLSLLVKSCQNIFRRVSLHIFMQWTWTMIMSSVIRHFDKKTEMCIVSMVENKNKMLEYVKQKNTWHNWVTEYNSS